MKTFSVKYRFTLNPNQKRTFTLHINEATLETAAPIPDDYPWWAALDFHQCSNCPFSVDQRDDCPVAIGISTIITPFEKLSSFDVYSIFNYFCTKQLES